MALLSLMICKSSCVWDLLLYYFTELPQPIHGLRARVVQVSGGAQRSSEPQERHSDRLLRGGGPSGTCWRRGAEVVQGDPLSAREISSWWDVCTSGMVSCTGIIVSYQSCFHCSIRLKLEFARDAAWRLKGRRERNVGVDGWGFGLLQCGHVKGDERCLVEPNS